MDTPARRGGQPDRTFYARSVDYFSAANAAAFGRHIDERKAYIDGVFGRIAELDRRRGPLRVIELGAGTCLTTLLVRDRLGRGDFSCLDISLSRMATLSGQAARRVGADAEGLHFIEADITHDLDLASATFDLVMFDASLHHSRNIWTTLAEAGRVCAPGGAVVAMREAFLSPMTYGIAIRRLLRSPEFAAGVAENAYLRAQYDYYFRAAGLVPEFLPVFPDWKWRLLSPLNGLALAKYNIWSTPKP